MKELKFYKESESQRSKIPNKDNIYSGNFKFTTQNTAVYDNYSLVESEKEIMKINVDCDKIFAKNGQIAILKNNKLDIFEHCKLIKSLEIEKSKNIRDFLLDFENDLKKVVSTNDLFIINGKEMVVTDKKISFDGKDHRNEIHEPRCEYFVAWNDKIAILGNNMSFNFMYFYDGELAEAEEYSPLTVRTDEESLDSIPPIDIKFINDKLLVIDNDIISIFKIADFEGDKNYFNKDIVDYDIKDGMIVSSEIANLILTKEPTKMLEPGTELLADWDKSSIFESDSKAIVNSTSKTADIKPVINSDGESKESRNPTSENLKFTDFESNMNKSSNNKESINPPSESMKFTAFESTMNKDLINPSSESLKFTAFESNMSKSSNNKQSNNPSSESLKFTAFEANMNKSSNIKEANNPPSEIKKIDDEFNLRINELKNSFKELQKKKTESKCLTFVPSKFDFDGIYNLIFHNHINDYENVLSSMIFQIENLQSISESNILESIKYFDSKIFQKKSIKKSVKYSDPLCIKIDSCLHISNPFDDLLEGIKVLQVKEQSSNIKFEKSNEQPKSSIKLPEIKPTITPVELPKPVDTNISNAPINTTPSKPIIENLLKPKNIDLPSISVPFGANVPNFLQKKPEPTNPPANNLFNNNAPQNINFVNDTTSLFSNIASNNMNIPSINSQGAPSNTTQPQQPDGSNGPVSAFNRLAGSRRLFQ